mgnify:CR=1 FL=1
MIEKRNACTTKLWANVWVGDVISLINYAFDELRNEHRKDQCLRIGRM